MKVAQNDETDPNMHHVCPPHTPSISNTQLSPFGTYVRKRETPGILSRMFPTFAGTSYRVRAHLAPLLVMSCIDMHLFASYSLFLPSLLSGRLRDRRRYWCPDRLRCWRTLLARGTGQAPPPFLSSRYRPFHSLMLALDFTTVIVCPILMHSLLLYLLLYLTCLS